MNSPDERHRTFPTLFQSLLIIGFLFVLEIAVAVLYVGFAGTFENGDPVATGVIITLANLLLFWLLLRYKNLSLAELFHPGPSSPQAVMLLLGVPVVLMFSGGAILMSDLLQWLLTLMPMTQGQYDMFKRLMSGGVVSLLLACVLAPVVEEMLCRGIFLRSFLRQYSPVQAIVFSSAVFAIFHMNIFQALVGFMVGAALGWIAVRAQSLWPCVLGHAAYNFACYGLAVGVFESDRVQLTGAAVTSAGIPLFVHLLAVLFVLIGGFMLWKLLGGSLAAGRQAE